jgi:acetyltransferase-like isoleucine patch superfamily enzyme
VGSNAVFLDGAYVGRGSGIGAGALVRGFISRHPIFLGVPARVIRSRNSRTQTDQVRRRRCRSRTAQRSRLLMADRRIK